ncbi:MAG: glycosyltransferase family 1 protein [Dactylosporangium sp.]|nr:glycosyltransferase [Dactylosporangium sp.]NNJ62267.1 glycosyltransferase family 1 protein [Dactylosporangium sp.]
MTRLLCVAPPFSGHLNPLIALAKHLRDQGFEPRFATGPARVDQLRRLGFAADPVLADRPGAFERIADTPGPVRGNPYRLGRQLAANLALLPEVRRALDAIVDRDRPELVLADFTAPVAGLAADRAGIPWITTMPSPFVLETRTGTPAYCGGWGRPRHLGHRLRDAAGRAGTRAVKRALGTVFAGQLRAAGTQVYRTDGTEAAYSPLAILGLGLSELEFDRDWPAAFEMIGPVTEAPEPMAGLPPALPEGPLVLVTLGTHLWWAKSTLVASVRRLAAAYPSHHFVVSLGRPAPAPAGSPLVDGRITVFDYLPYDQVMARCDAVVHHGGAGITYSAIRAGRPSLVWPCDYDQFDYAARIVDRGAGLAVRRLDSAAAVTALGRVLGGLDSGARDRLARAVAGYDPFAATEQAVRRALWGTSGLGEFMPGGA